MIIEKIADVEYIETLALAVIEKDPDLYEIFSDDISMSFNLVKTLSKENKLSEETKTFIKDLFDNIILTKISLVNKYLYFAKLEGKDLHPIMLNNEEPEVEEVKEPKKRNKIESSLPRRYGKDKIEQDIMLNGGKPNNAQLTALMVNDLKNIYTRLNTRMVNDLLTDDHIYTDEEYREIRATIQIVKNKLRNLLKKK